MNDIKLDFQLHQAHSLNLPSIFHCILEKKTVIWTVLRIITVKLGIRIKNNQFMKLTVARFVIALRPKKVGDARYGF